MSDEAVKRRLRRVICIALADLRDMEFIAEKIHHPFFHIKAQGIHQARWIHISLDVLSPAEKARAKDPKIEGRKEIWLLKKRSRRFDKYFY